MARLIQSSDGALSGTVWSPGVTATSGSAEIDVETLQTLSTANHDSATFVLPATEIDGVVLKLAANTQAAITFTVHLRNSTTATNDRSVTVNAADMPLCTAGNRTGGWQFFKFSSPITPNGTDSFLIRCTISAGTTIGLWRDGTTNNFSRFIRATATTAPAAADRFICARELTGAGTGTSRSLTIPSGLTDTYGNSTGLSTSGFTAGGGVNAAFCISNGATVTWDNAAATNYLLKLTGSLMVYAGGTWTRGTAISPIPRDSTAILEFVLAVTNDSGVFIGTGATYTEEGLSRTSGKDVIWCLLNTDEAAGQTVLGVDTDTGWLNNDSIVIASTSRTQGEAELKVLNGNAGASSMTITVALSSAHKGTQDCQGEIILLTRNVVTRSDNAGRFWKWEPQDATMTQRWVQFQFASSMASILSNANPYILEYCSFDRPAATVLTANSGGTIQNFTWRHLVIYMTANAQAPSISSLPTTNWIVSDLVNISTNGGGGIINTINTAGFGECHDLRATGTINLAQAGVPTAPLPSTFKNFVVHSANSGLSLGPFFGVNTVVEGIKAWRVNATGVSIQGGQIVSSNFVLKDLVAFGNTGVNVNFEASAGGEITLDNPVIAGDTSFSSATGISIANVTGSNVVLFVKLLGGILGGGGDTKTTHTTQDILWGSALLGRIVNLLVVNTDLLSATEVTVGSGLRQPSFYARQAPDGTLANTSVNFSGRGTVAYNTSIVHAPDTVSEHLIPAVTFNATLHSAPMRVNVASGVAPTVTVWVRRTAGYNGAFEPRLVIRANPAVGIDDDTVLDTLSVGADTWEQLTGTPAAPTLDGQMEFYVEVGGTVDGAFVGSWTSSVSAAASGNPSFWFDGLRAGSVYAAGGAGSGGGAVIAGRGGIATGA